MMRSQVLVRFISVLLSFALVVLTLPPFDIGWAALALLLPLLYALTALPLTFSAVFGVCWGALVGSYMYLGVAAYSKPVFALTVGVVASVGIVLFVLTALALRSKRTGVVLCVPLIWVLSEYALNAVGIPYTVAVLLAEQAWLIQPVRLGGPHFLAALIYLLQTCLFVGLTRPTYRLGSALGAGVLIVLGYGVAQLVADDDSVDTLRVSAIQTNSHPYGYMYRAADGVLEASIAQRQALHAKVPTDIDLVVWPEWAVLGYPFRLTDFSAALEGEGVNSTAAQLINAQDLNAVGVRRNLVVGVNAQGAVTSTSGKATLIPFIEQSVSPSTERTVHHSLPGSPLSTICYESVFAGSIANRVREGAGLITVLTSDAYAGPSLIPVLHGRYAALRAVENNRYVVRAANGGISMIVSHRGKVEQSLPLFEQGVLTGTVQVFSTITPFSRFSEIWWWGLLVAGLMGAVTVLVDARQAQVALRTSTSAMPATRAAPVWLALIGVTAVVSVIVLSGQNRYVSGLLMRSMAVDVKKPSYALFFEDAFDTDLIRYQRTRVSDPQQSLSAAMAYVLRTYGVPTSSSIIAERLDKNVRSRQHELATLNDALSPSGFSLTEQNLDTGLLTMPVIAVMNSGEVVVVENLSGPKVALFSPVNGPIELDIDYFFERLATRQVLFIAPPARSWDN